MYDRELNAIRRTVLHDSSAIELNRLDFYVFWKSFNCDDFLFFLISKQKIPENCQIVSKKNVVVPLLVTDSV